MDVCPVTKGSFSIDELNHATEQGADVPAGIKAFAFHCVQCGKCVPVCPMNIRRDYIVRYLKSKAKEEKPWRYKRYLLIKGPKSGAVRLMQKLYVSLKKRTNRDIACYMETTPAKKAEVLFYPGCYIYSTDTVRQTLRLLDHIGCSYTVLGGVTSCCGAPHLLQGEFESADECLEDLRKKIKTAQPKIIITACAECFEAVSQIKTAYNERFEVLSVIQYLSRHMNKFPSKKTRGKIIVHDSCRFTKNSPQGVAARHTVSQFAELTEHTTQRSPCCFQWNYGHDPENTSRRLAYLSEIKKTAPTLACNCITCYEELKKIRTDVEIIDALQLFDEALKMESLKKK
jgi:Fe-S oxidoreductase